jgi:hypothetical protein
MAMLKIEIDLDSGSAMRDDPEAETASMLSTLVSKILTWQLGNVDGTKLLDTNGNSVGRVWIEKA